MENFGKSALRYQYFWGSKEDITQLAKFMRDDVIHRENGYAILNFINRFMAVHGLDVLGSFHKLEWMICKFMPHHLTTRHEMEEWLRKNWNNKQYY